MMCFAVELSITSSTKRNIAYLWGMNIERPSEDWKDYQLIDSGGFEKLERFGRYTMIRPEPKALWDKALPAADWKRRAQTAFTPGAGFSKAGKEDSGVWTMLGRMQEQWSISYRLPAVNEVWTETKTGAMTGSDTNPATDAAAILSECGGAELHLRLGLTAFKHVGVFPEQAPSWDFIYRQVARLRANNIKRGVTQPPRVLNLFAYTGAASLAACAAGAETYHVDSVRQVVTWARNNMELSGLEGIRWLIDDALKYVTRQVRKGSVFDGIILDPPAYGRGPDGERWKLDENLFDILKGCARLLSPFNSFLVLNLYSNGYSAMLSDTMVKCAFGENGTRTSGELVLCDSHRRILPLSVFTRLER